MRYNAQNDKHKYCHKTFDLACSDQHVIISETLENTNIYLDRVYSILQELIYKTISKYWHKFHI